MGGSSSNQMGGSSSDGWVILKYLMASFLKKKNSPATRIFQRFGTFTLHLRQGAFLDFSMVFGLELWTHKDFPSGGRIGYPP